MFVQVAESILNTSGKYVNTRFNPNSKAGGGGGGANKKQSIRQQYNKSSYDKFKNSKSYNKLKNIVKGNREVVVKVTGYSKGSQSVYNNLMYVSRNCEIEIHTDKDEVIESKEDIKEYLSQFRDNSIQGRPRNDSRDTVHFALSFPEADNDDLLKAVNDFAKTNFKEYEYLYALHEEENGKPHVHLIVQCRSKERDKTLRINRSQLQNYRDSFSEKLQELGYESNSTPRISRGNFKRPKKHIEYYSNKINIKQLQSVRDGIEKPSINENLEKVRDIYKDKIEDWKELSSELKKYDPDFSKDIDKFIKNINLESRQESLGKEILKTYNNKDQHRKINVDEDIKEESLPQSKDKDIEIDR